MKDLTKKVFRIDGKKLGYTKVVKFRSGRTGTKGYLATRGNVAVLAFRGTEKHMQGKGFEKR